MTLHEKLLADLFLSSWRGSIPQDRQEAVFNSLLVIGDRLMSPGDPRGEWLAFALRRDELMDLDLYNDIAHGPRACVVLFIIDEARKEKIYSAAEARSSPSFHGALTTGAAFSFVRDSARNLRVTFWFSMLEVARDAV